ncbi:MAG: hypothetical protein ACRYG8_17885 [Janthinobacterium lividum]
MPWDWLRICGVLCFGTALAILPLDARAGPAVQPADPSRPADLAILAATNHEISGRTIRNSCGSVVSAMIARPTPDTAVVLELDPTGSCSGSEPPLSAAVLVHAAAGWKSAMAFPAAIFDVGAVHLGHPDLIFDYPGEHEAHCPIAHWTGQTYELVRMCRNQPGRGR